MRPNPAVAPEGRFRTAIMLVVLAVALLVWQLGDLDRTALQEWDESRLAVNAIEMMLTGERLVTTYGFHPDLWNTKPPLAVNLMAWSMALLGPTALAARLPAALAACATVVLVGVAIRRITGSLGCGVAAGVLLTAAPLFYGYHSGQTGDYDAVLTLFTTGYCFALFALIERDRRAPRLALGAGALIGLALLTKGVAGVIPGAGVAFYALVFALPAPRRKIADYAIAIATATTIGGAFYWLRGRTGDGYLAAVAVNELGGRYGAALDQHRGDKWFYTRALTASYPGKAWLAIFALPLLPAGPARRLAIFGLCQIVGVLLVYSNAATKIIWYIVPAMPFVATVAALAGLGVVRATMRLPPVAALGVRAILTAAVVYCVVVAIDSRYLHPARAPFPPRAFDTLIAAAAARQMVPLAVVDTGFPNTSGFVNYAPTLRFYALAAARRGIAVRQATGFHALGGARAVGSCDPAVRDRIAIYAKPVWSGSGCVLAIR